MPKKTNQPRFSSRVTSILRDADRKVRGPWSADPYGLYDYWRATMGKICQVDTFYVGFYREDRTIVYPYNFDEQAYSDPDVHTYGEHGMCAWTLEHKRPYLWSMDNGRLLGMGYAFGNKEKQSLDAVVIPLFDETSGTSEVVGAAGMHSYSPNAYSQESVRAFQWLARGIMTGLTRERQDAINRLELGIGEVDQFRPLTLSEVIEDVSGKLQGLRQRIIEARTAVDEGTLAAEHLDSLDAHCQRIQTETMEILIRPSVDGMEALSRLTAKEREVAVLIAEGLSNQEIAERLHITEPTAKTHVSRILQKFGVKQRAGVATMLRPFA